MRLSTKASISDSGSEDGDSSSSAATTLFLCFMRNFNTFVGRALLFGAVALILCILLGFIVPATALASGQFVVYGTLVALLASVVYEIVLVFTKQRRPETTTVGAGIFGSIAGGFLVAAVSMLCKIIV